MSQARLIVEAGFHHSSMESGLMNRPGQTPTSVVVSVVLESIVGIGKLSSGALESEPVKTRTKRSSEDPQEPRLPSAPTVPKSVSTNLLKITGGKRKADVPPVDALLQVHKQALPAALSPRTRMLTIEFGDFRGS